MSERMDSRTPNSPLWLAIFFERSHLNSVSFDWSHMPSFERPMRYSHSFPVGFLASFFSSAVNVGSYLAAFFSRPFYP